MIVAFIDADRHRSPVVVMCDVLGLAERTYDAAKQRTPSVRTLADQAVSAEIRRLWESNYWVYRAKRV